MLAKYYQVLLNRNPTSVHGRTWTADSDDALSSTVTDMSAYSFSRRDSITDVFL